MEVSEIPKKTTNAILAPDGMAGFSLLAFRPEILACPTHGDYQANHRGADGIERWLPQCPRCATERRSRAATHRSAIPPRFQDRELVNYHAETPGQQAALQQASDYAREFSARRRLGTSLIFTGTVGTGKTHLACGIAHALLRSGYTALFTTVGDLIRSLRDTWRKNSHRTESDVLDGYAAVDLLILDEVGVQAGSEDERRLLFEVINRRYSHRLPLVVITNLPLVAEQEGGATIQEYLGLRAFDRLREGGGKVVIFDWPSYRGKAGRVGGASHEKFSTKQG